ncbi:MAG: hypothetical protein AB7O66_03630 [Limisphaerales bacterium]
MAIRRIVVSWVGLGSRSLGLLGALLLPSSFSSRAADGESVSLFEYAFNLNGSITSFGAPLPGGGSGFNLTTGLGLFEYTVRDPGRHSVLFFLDHEMSEPVNSYRNEIGGVSTQPVPAGLTWEVDDPGWSGGNVLQNFLLNELDGTVATTSPGDVSMSLGWEFDLNPGQEAVIRFSVSELEPDGFYLTHHDPDSGERIYFDSALTLSAVPELGAGALVSALGLLGLATARCAFRNRPAAGKRSAGMGG